MEEKNFIVSAGINMKYKKILVIIILIIICSGGWFLKFYKCIGSLNSNTTSKITSKDSFEIKMKENKKIKLTYNLNVKEGTLAFIVVDDNNNVICELPTNEKGEETIDLEKDNVYRVRVEYTDFIGDIKLNAYYGN